MTTGKIRARCPSYPILRCRFLYCLLCYIVQTMNASETADYSLLGVERFTPDGKTVFHGVTAYSTNSTGQLSFLNNTLGFFKEEGDLKSRNFVSTEWELE
jgi:hypothetical protein